MIQGIYILGSLDFASITVLLGAVLVPLITYIVATRQFSGKIRNSDADALWMESRSIREWGAQRMEEQNRTIARLEERVEHVEAENRALQAEKETLTERISTLNDTITSLRGQIGDLTNELKHSRNHLVDAEEHDDK